MASMPPMVQPKPCIVSPPLPERTKAATCPQLCPQWPPVGAYCPSHPATPQVQQASPRPFSQPVRVLDSSKAPYSRSLSQFDDDKGSSPNQITGASSRLMSFAPRDPVDNRADPVETGALRSAPCGASGCVGVGHRIGCLYRAPTTSVSVRW